MFPIKILDVLESVFFLCLEKLTVATLQIDCNIFLYLFISCFVILLFLSFFRLYLFIGLFLTIVRVAILVFCGLRGIIFHPPCIYFVLSFSAFRKLIKFHLGYGLHGTDWTGRKYSLQLSIECL
jgi:hypothetical protein